MGIVVLADDTIGPFPRRFFGALVEQEINRGADRGIWEALVVKFDRSGSMLDISDLNSDEFLAFKHGIEELDRQMLMSKCMTVSRRMVSSGLSKHSKVRLPPQP